MITKKTIMQELSLNNTWNKIHNCFGLRVATVLWQTKNAWKIVTTDDFDKITDWNDKTYIVAEFYEQKDLCNHLYNKLNSITA